LNVFGNFDAGMRIHLQIILLGLLLVALTVSAQTNDTVPSKPSPDEIVSITNLSGGIYRDIKVVKTAPDGIFYVYADTNIVGGGKIDFDHLPDFYKLKYPYSPPQPTEYQEYLARINTQCQQEQDAKAQEKAILDDSKRETAAYQAETADYVGQTIKLNAQREWPNDYEMQAYVMKNQAAAYNAIQTQQPPTDIPTSAYSQIKSDAQNNWSGDYEMQAYIIKQQVQAYRNVNQ
jgi:hypothetical protein